MRDERQVSQVWFTLEEEDTHEVIEQFRLTMKEMILSAKNAGFEVEIPRVIKWESMPTPIQEMDSSFHDKDETELNICTFLMIMRKP